jgi:hypothetical protein
MRGEKKSLLLSLGFAKYPIYHFNPTHWSRVYTNFSLLGVEGWGHIDHKWCEGVMGARKARLT